MSQEPPQKFSAIYFTLWEFHEPNGKMYKTNDISQKSVGQLNFHTCKNSTKIIIKFYTLQGEQCKKSHKIWTVFELVMNFLIWKKNKKCEKQCATVPQTSTACQKRKMKIKSQFWKIISTFIHVLRMFIIKIQHEQIIIKFNNPYTVGKISQHTSWIST